MTIREMFSTYGRNTAAMELINKSGDAVTIFPYFTDTDDKDFILFDAMADLPIIKWYVGFGDKLIIYVDSDRRIKI